MNDTLEQLINIFNDYSIGYIEENEDNDVGFNNFTVDTWDVTPKVNYNEILITIFVRYQSFKEYLEMWSPTFQETLNKTFAFIDSRYRGTEKLLEVDLYIKIDKKLI